MLGPCEHQCRDLTIKLQHSDQIYRVFYVSRAKIDPCGPEPRHILETSLARNGPQKITGVLYFSGDHFAQLLEGPGEPLQSLMLKIEQDQRHEMLMQWPMVEIQDARWYPGWSMCYVLDERLESLIEALLEHGPASDFGPLERRLSVDTDNFHLSAFKLQLGRWASLQQESKPGA